MASSDPSSPAGSFLNPAEVENLLAASSRAEPARATVVRRGGTPAATEGVRSYDFRNPCLVSEAELRRLKLMHEDYARFLGARLSLALRMDVGVSLSSFGTTTYARFTEALANPSHLSLFKIEPLQGVGILDLDVPLALAMADRLLGGRGAAGKPRPFLTEIEAALLEEVTATILEDWCAQWKSEQPLRPTVIGHEHGGRFLQTSPKDAIIVALVLNCTFGEGSGRIQLGLPYHTLEPLIARLQERKNVAARPASRRAAWHGAYDSVAMPVRAEWQAFELTVREITSLRVGDVIEMKADICADTHVLLNGLPKFIGSVGLDSNRVAVQLTRKLPTEES